MAQRYVTKSAACAALDTVPTAATSVDMGAEIRGTSNPGPADPPMALSKFALDDRLIAQTYLEMRLAVRPL